VIHSWSPLVGGPLYDTLSLTTFTRCTPSQHARIWFEIFVLFAWNLSYASLYDLCKMYGARVVLGEDRVSFEDAIGPYFQANMCAIYNNNKCNELQSKKKRKEKRNTTNTQTRTRACQRMCILNLSDPYLTVPTLKPAYMQSNTMPLGRHHLGLGLSQMPSQIVPQH
jgi:hypothetical protein